MRKQQVCVYMYIYYTCWVHTFYVIYLYINIYIYTQNQNIYIYRIVLDVSSSRDTILTTRLTLHPFSLTLTIPIKTSSKHPLSTIPGRYILRCIQDDGNCIVLKTTTAIVYNSQYLVHPSSTSLIFKKKQCSTLEQLPHFERQKHSFKHFTNITNK